MKDEYGRLQNKAQAIRSFNKVEMSYLLNDIKDNPDKYPCNQSDWYEWLQMDSGETVSHL